MTLLLFVEGKSGYKDKKKLMRNARKKKKRQTLRLELQPAPGNFVFDYTCVDEGLPSDAISQNGSADTADEPASGGKSATSADVLSAMTQPGAAPAAANPAASVLPVRPEAEVGEPIFTAEPAGTSGCPAAVLAHPVPSSPTVSLPPELRAEAEHGLPDLGRPGASAVAKPPRLSPVAPGDKLLGPHPAAGLAHPNLPSSALSLPPELHAEAAHAFPDLDMPAASDVPQLSPAAFAVADRMSSPRQDLALAQADPGDNNSSGGPMSHDAPEQAVMSSNLQVQLWVLVYMVCLVLSVAVWVAPCLCAGTQCFCMAIKHTPC